MHITHLRNATVVLEFQAAGQSIGLLVDPMLAPRGSLPALRSEERRVGKECRL